MPTYTDGGGGLAATMPLTNYTPTPAWYRSQVETEPGYVSWKTGADAARQGAGTNRRAAIRALALQYGGVPADYQDAYGDLTPDLLAVDAANPDSQMNRLKNSYATQQQQLQTSLAARGALHSGDLVFGNEQLANANQSNLADAASAFMGAPGQGGVQGAYADYTGAYNDAYAGQGDAINNALQVLQGEYPAGTTATATLDPAWESKYNVPVYTAPDGSLYQIGADGNLAPFTPPDAGGGGGGGGGGATAGTQSVQYPSGTYMQNGVLINASTGLPVSAGSPGVAPAAGYSNLAYRRGGAFQAI